MNRTLLPRLFGERPERFGAALPPSRSCRDARAAGAAFRNCRRNPITILSPSPGESFRTGRNVFPIVSGPAAERGIAPRRCARFGCRGAAGTGKRASTRFGIRRQPNPDG